MNTPSALRFMLGLVVLLSLVTVTYAGGWDIVTFKDFPDFAVAGQSLNLTFTVWVPSLEPLANVHPNIRATPCLDPCSTAPPPRPPNATETRGLVAKASVKGDATTREYTAALILPEPGDWVITIDTEYAGASTLAPLRVIAPGTPPPTPFSPAARGLRLFTAKGCSACHLRDGVGRVYGPDLTGKPFDSEHLKKFLADPSITPVPEEVCNSDRSYCGSPYAMPNLNLKDAEIEALIAFINKR
jgi:mono/diheme cytochrome c family protein